VVEPFGSVGHRTSRSERCGAAGWGFFAKPSTARRICLLQRVALEIAQRENVVGLLRRSTDIEFLPVGLIGLIQRLARVNREVETSGKHMIDGG
jgi:hypothetical protein